jgi:carbamate kinase
MFQMALHNIFLKRGINKIAATVVTQVVVDPKDPAFQKPSKPIGPFYKEEEAKEREKADGWSVVEDSGRGWRRVVASPIPKEIVEEEAIKSLIAKGFIVIAVGGGGIPVVKHDDGTLKGTAAVIDKDFASSLLASNIKADVFVISTAVEKVCLNFGKPDQKELDKMTLADCKKFVEEGHFKPGSMLPKIKAIISFLEKGGEKAIITNPENLKKALEGKTGTHITKDAVLSQV